MKSQLKQKNSIHILHNYVNIFWGIKMSELYNKIDELCKLNNVSISLLCLATGISRSALSELKAGRNKSISSDNLSKIADYFRVPTDYILGKMNQDNNELNEYLDILASREDLRMLFKLAKDASKDDVDKAVKIIEALKKYGPTPIHRKSFIKNFL